MNRPAPPDSENETPRSSRIERFLARSMLVLLATIAGGLILEFLLRAVGADTRSTFERQFPVEVYRRPRPYVMFGGQRNGRLDDHESLNVAGYRGNAASPNKDPERFRIAILGGSTVFNGAPPLPQLLDQRFAEERAGNVEVYNFGVVSSVSGMELSRLVHEVVDCRPDLVVFYNGANDLLHPLHWDARPGYPFNFVMYENNPLLAEQRTMFPVVTGLAKSSALFKKLKLGNRAVKKRLAQVRQDAGYKTEAWREQIVEHYLNNMHKSRVMAEACGAQCIVVFQPMLAFKDDRTSETWSVPDEELEHCVTIRRKIRQQIAKLPDVEQADFYDLSDIYDDTSDCVFSDSVHTHQQFKPVVAHALHAIIAPRIRQHHGEHAERLKETSDR